MNQYNLKIHFHSFVANYLAELLPYRKKSLLFGPRVCEFAAVLLMGKGAFFLGGSLCLVNKSAAEEALAQAAGPQDWKTAFKSIMESLKERTATVAPDTATYNTIFPEESGANMDRPRQLLSPEECGLIIQQRVLFGLLYGVLFPDMMLSMLKAWIAQKDVQQDLKVGGLKAQERPFLTSIEQAYESARSVYEAWTQS